MKAVYLDNGASTMTDPEVIRAMLPYFEKNYANASSAHFLGQEAKRALEKSREAIARLIGAETEEIIFTSGGTESNNLAVRGVALAARERGKHIIATKIEHDSVLAPCRLLESEGFEVTYLGVDREGFVSLEELEKAIRPDTILISVIHGNNEIGTVQPLEKISKIIRKKSEILSLPFEICFHSDACQSFGKVPIDVKRQGLGLMTLNSHKIHGPKGVGALYVRSGVEIIPQSLGGGHERGLRSGTENIPGIVGFAKAARLAQDEKHLAHMKTLRDRLISGLLEHIPGAKLNGPKENRLCNNANLSFPASGDILGDYLNAFGICSSKGSACGNIGEKKTSHVLAAIGLSPEEAESSLRLTLSRFTTEEEIDFALEKIIEAARNMRKGSFLEKIIGKLERQNDRKTER